MEQSVAFTNSVKPLQTENVLDPRLEAMRYGQDRLKWGIFKGTQSQNWVQEAASSYSTAGIQWNVTTQGPKMLLDRRVYARVQFQMTFTGSVGEGQYLLVDASDAPRAMPLAAITNNLNMQIDGTGFSCVYQTVIEAMLRYNNPFQQRQYDLSQSPSMLDKHARYEDGVAGNRNPLAGYNDSAYEIGRGAFFLDSITQEVGPAGGGTVTSTVKFTVTEPIIMSPFLYSCRDLQSAFYGLNRLNAQFTFAAGQLERIWSHAVTSGISVTTKTVDIGPSSTSPPELLLNYLEPPLLDGIGENPVAPVYQYYETETHISEVAKTAAPSSGPGSNSVTVVVPSIQMPRVPSSIYLWFSRTNGTKTYNTTDTALRVDSLTLFFLGRSGQFSNATPNDLYAICCKNGLDLSYTEFRGLTQTLPSGDLIGLTGSYIKLDAEDLGIPDNMAPGVATGSSLSIQATVANVNQVETLSSIQINLVAVYDGLVTINNGKAIQEQGIVDSTIVIETRKNNDWVDFSKAQRMYGGSFWGKLGSLAKKAAPTVLHYAADALGKGGALVGGMLEETKGGANMKLSELRKRLLS